MDNKWFYLSLLCFMLAFITFKCNIMWPAFALLPACMYTTYRNMKFLLQEDKS